MSRAERKRQTYELCLATAADLFKRWGYERVTIRGIAAAMGMSTGAVFGQNPSKAALFKAATGRDAPDVRRFLRHEQSSGSPATRRNAADMERDLYGIEP